MHWLSSDDQGHPPPPHPPSDHTPFLVHLIDAVSHLHKSSGRIEATLEHIGGRLEDGDGQFREIKTDLNYIKGEVATLKASKPSAEKPSRLSSLKELAGVAFSAIKEAWPFLAFAGAGIAKYLGVDISGLHGP